MLPLGLVDFNGDGHKDVVAAYQYPNNKVGILAWQTVPGKGATYVGSIWESRTGWGNIASMRPAGNIDVSNDGREDINILYTYGDSTKILSWAVGTHKLNYKGINWTGGVKDWGASANLKPAGTMDINRDGKRDLVMFYQYPNATVGILAWTSNKGTAGFKYRGLAWKSQATFGNIAAMRPAGAYDASGDGHEDLAAFYVYANGSIRLLSWPNLGGYTLGNQVSQWGADKAWGLGSNVIPLGNLRMNPDGKTDVVAFYNYGNGVTGILNWVANAGKGTTYKGRAWLSGKGWGNVPDFRPLG